MSHRESRDCDIGRRALTPAFDNFQSCTRANNCDCSSKIGTGRDGTQSTFLRFGLSICHTRSWLGWFGWLGWLGWFGGLALLLTLEKSEPSRHSTFQKRMVENHGSRHARSNDNSLRSFLSKHAKYMSIKFSSGLTKISDAMCLFT